MRTIIAALVSLSLGAGAVNAESVFDSGFAAPPRLELEARRDGLSRSASPVPQSAAAAAGDRTIGIAAWSLLLPGLAQQKLGHDTRAKIYYGIETLTWIAAGSFLYAGYVREKAYKDYAVVFAGVRGTDRPDGYWETIGVYLSSDGPGGYNEMVRRDARDFYYPDLDAMNAYYEERAYTGADGWQWRSSAEFYRYANLRDDSRFAYRYALYAVFAAATLRIVSAGDAVRLARSEARTENDSGARTSLEIAPSPVGAALYLVRTF